MTTHPVLTTRRRPALLIGVGLAGLLAVGDVVTGFQAVNGEFFAPPMIGVVMIALGVLTMVLIPLVVAGRRTASWALVTARLVSALTGVPAFFVGGVPAAAVVLAAAGIALAVLVGALVLPNAGSRS